MSRRVANERRQIFVDDKDRRHFLEFLAATDGMFSLRGHAFVLMSNDYHLLLEITEVNLSRSVQWLNTSYAVWFNRRHRRSGHLFQGGSSRWWWNRKVGDWRSAATFI